MTDDHRACPECGTLGPRSRFCGSCGARLVGPEGHSAGGASEPSRGAGSADPPASGPAARTSAGPTAASTAEPDGAGDAPGAGGRTVGAWFLAGVLLAGVVGALAVVLVRPGGERITARTVHGPADGTRRTSTRAAEDLGTVVWRHRGTRAPGGSIPLTGVRRVGGTTILAHPGRGLLGLRDGRVAWRLDTVATPAWTGLSTGPGDGRTLVVAAEDELVRVDPVSGRITARSGLEGTVPFPVLARPLGERHLLPVDDALVAVRAGDGAPQPVWRLESTADRPVVGSRPTPWVGLSTAPRPVAAAGDRLVVVDGSSIRLVGTGTGEVLTSLAVLPPGTSGSDGGRGRAGARAAFGDDLVYVARQGFLAAFDRSTGRLVWRRELESRRVVRTVGSDESGAAIALVETPQQGTRLMTFSVDGSVSGDLGVAAPVPIRDAGAAAGGMLVAGDGQLALYRPGRGMVWVTEATASASGGGASRRVDGLIPVPASDGGVRLLDPDTGREVETVGVGAGRQPPPLLRARSGPPVSGDLLIDWQTGERTRARAIGSGRERWTARLGYQPLTVGDLIVGVGRGNRLRAHDRDGQSAWTWSPDRRHQASTSVVGAVRDMVVVNVRRPRGEGSQGGPTTVTHVIDATTGRARWSGRPEAGTPRRILVGADGTVVGLLTTGDGAVLARLRIPDGGRLDVGWTRPLTRSSSVALAGGRVVVASPTFVRALEPADGGTIWRTPFRRFVRPSGLAVRGQQVLVTSGRTVLSMDLATGSRGWEQQLPGVISTVPTVAGDLAYLGTTNGQVVALGPDGGVRLRRSLDRTLVGAPVVARGLLMSHTSRGGLLALGSSTPPAATGGEMPSSPVPEITSE